jgi:hypothetical protein
MSDSGLDSCQNRGEVVLPKGVDAANAAITGIRLKNLVADLP